MLKIFKFAAFFVLLSTVYAYAEKRILTVDEAVKFALENNVSVKETKNALELAKRQNSYSWNSISPSVSLNGGYSQDFENNTSSVSVSGKVSAGLSSNLYSSIKGAKLNYEKAALSYEEVSRSVEISVRKAFYNLLYEKENIVLQRRNLETLEAQYKQNEAKFKSGQISELDVLTSRVSYEKNKPVLEEAVVSFENSLSSFKQLTGLPLDEEISLNGSLDDILNIKTFNFPDENNVSIPSVLSAEKSVEIAKNSLLSSRFSAYSPSVSAGYSYGKSNSPLLENWKTSNEFSLGVGIPLDGVLPWSSKAANIDSAKSSLTSAELSLQKAKTSAKVEAESLKRKINQSVSLVESLKSNVELAEESYKMSKTAYNYGKIDFMALQNASDSVLSAAVSLKRQAYTLISNILDYEQLLGMPFGSLSLVN